MDSPRAARLPPICNSARPSAQTHSPSPARGRFIHAGRIGRNRSARDSIGTTDPITGMVADWIGTIITAYVGGRSIEKVARIFKRQAPTFRSEWV
jgi:hypothetical protein